MNARARVSVLVNTCNEGNVLGDCLASVAGWADEIIVCDMESTDDSVSVSKAYGAIVWNHVRKAAPEPEARTFGISKCAGDWILVLDPDMRISPELRTRLNEIVSRDEADIVDLHCLNFFFTRWCAHGHGSQPVFRKFFKRKLFHPSPINIQTFWHDSLLEGRVIALPKQYAITHYAYPSIQGLVAIVTRYARKEADDDFMLGRRFRLHLLLWKPVKRFAGDYILRRGFLDGLPGLIVAVIIAWYRFLIEAYLWELSCHPPNQE